VVVLETSTPCLGVCLFTTLAKKYLATLDIISNCKLGKMKLNLISSICRMYFTLINDNFVIVIIPSMVNVQKQTVSVEGKVKRVPHTKHKSVCELVNFI